MGDLAGAEKDFYLARNEESKFSKNVASETNPAKPKEDGQPKETRETTDTDIESSICWWLPTKKRNKK